MSIEIRNPANPSEVVGSFETITPDEVPAMIASAHKAQREWAKVTQQERGRLVEAFLDALEARADDIATSITREMGKIIAESHGEVAKALGEGRATTRRASSPIGEVLPSQKPGTVTYSTRRPRGVIVGINPWNFPFSTPIRKTVPALLYGNAMVLKPSVSTPGAAFIMQEVADAILPKGLFQVAYGSGALGAALTSAQGVNAISFTGSVGIGRIVAQAAAANLAEISLELGGKNPVILNDASDLEVALDQIYAAAFSVCGQRCTAISRVIVRRELEAQVVDGLAQRAKAAQVGDGLDTTSTIGPLMGEKARADVAGFVSRAVADGAVVAAGGEMIDQDGGYFYAPTVLCNVTPDMEVARDEVFGPVLAVIPYDTPDEALAICNDVEFGLSACLYSEQTPLVERFVSEAESGMLHVNCGSFPEDHAPFVGVKNSSLGVGGSNGPSTLHFYTQEHTVFRKGQA
ncbi:aldehyde dehydrogenase family protein [Ruegeria lacuscaerulensis]|uniref:aldehyde dehydrogenase family protein n=1 Tax=Ruegeria lacuscaerulensis TaxID=55218 RepID=UPI00147FC20C|nr:aldehyde dehydrogenase family protein [Ruegeria lacuscaerulensis]